MYRSPRGLDEIKAIMPFHLAETAKTDEARERFLRIGLGLTGQEDPVRPPIRAEAIIHDRAGRPGRPKAIDPSRDDPDAPRAVR
jgi:hypothetical protein